MSMASVIAFAGSKRDLDQIHLPGDTFHVVHKFEIPDDHGEFPDTSGYTADNYAQMTSNMEDSSLWPVMQKCFDAVLDYTLKQEKKMCDRRFINVRSTINYPKFGSTVFVVAGIVTGEPAEVAMGKRIIIAN